MYIRDVRRVGCEGPPGGAWAGEIEPPLKPGAQGSDGSTCVGGSGIREQEQQQIRCSARELRYGDGVVDDQCHARCDMVPCVAVENMQPWYRCCLTMYCC